MSDYRRYFVAGGTYFFTIVTHFRRPLFARERNVQWLREAVAAVKQVLPFDIHAAVVLPDHLHFIWSLPRGDSDYSKRIGLIKVKFTQRIRDAGDGPAIHKPASASRQKHNESDLWQRRFWEHTIDHEDEFQTYFDYVHYNPVRHQQVSCPHLWKASSFHHWVKRGVYDKDWACQCYGRQPFPFDFSKIKDRTGE